MGRHKPKSLPKKILAKCKMKLNLLKRNKIKIIYKGDSSYPNVSGLIEAEHSALCAYIYRFSNDGPYFEARLVDPQKLAQVASLSQHWFVCPPAFYRGLQFYVVKVFCAFVWNYVTT